MHRLRKRLAMIAVGITTILAFGTIGFMLVEHVGWLDAFYMTVITVTTIGYGEVFPLGTAGRIFNICLIAFGVTVILAANAGITQTVVELELNNFFGKRRVKKMIDRLNGHIILCGYGRVGRGAAEELIANSVPFVIIDNSEERVERAMKDGLLAVLADASSDVALKEVGIDRARGLISALRSDADNLYVVLTAKTLNPKLQCLTRADEDSAESKMRRAGADFVFTHYKSTGTRMAQAIAKPHVHQFLDSTTRNMGLNVAIEQVEVDEKSALIGRSLGDLNIGRDTGTIVLALRRADGKMLFNPSGLTQVSGRDHLIAMGEAEGLRKLETLLGPSKR